MNRELENAGKRHRPWRYSDRNSDIEVRAETRRPNDYLRVEGEDMNLKDLNLTGIHML